MKAHDFIDLLREHDKEVFTTKEASVIIGKPVKYASLWLSTIKGIKRLEKGKYFIINTDPYNIASKILKPSYITMSSAFRFYNITTQMPLKIYVVSTARHRKINIEGYDVVFIKTSKNRMFGYSLKNEVFVADIEKAFIDALYFKNYGLAGEAVENAVEKGLFNAVKFKDYTLKMSDKSLVNRCGYFLEAHKIKADELLKFKSSKKTMFTKGNKIDKRWNVAHA